MRKTKRRGRPPGPRPLAKGRTVRLPADIDEWLKAVARERNVSVSSLVATMVESALPLPEVQR